MHMNHILINEIVLSWFVLWQQSSAIINTTYGASNMIP